MRPKSASAVPDILTMNFDTVSIRVGEKIIPVYKDFLTSVSPYFQKAFNGSFKKADERSIALEGISEQTFRIFLYWIHAQSLQFDTSSAALDHSALLPPHEVARLATSSDKTAQSIEENNDEEDEGNESDTTSQSGRTPAFDEEAFHTRCETETLYFESTIWVGKSNLFHLTVAELFVFADKYMVPQLRDDILTAFVGQCWKWNWWPDEATDLVNIIYSNMPASSTFAKFLACSIAWVGFPGDKGDAVDRMQSLRRLNPDLAFEVGVTYAKQAQGHKDHDVSVDISTNLPNSCLFHEHSLVDQEQCRKRIANRPHIFTAILDACAKDVRGAS